MDINLTPCHTLWPWVNHNRPTRRVYPHRPPVTRPPIRASGPCPRPTTNNTSTSLAHPTIPVCNINRIDTDLDLEYLRHTVPVPTHPMACTRQPWSPINTILRKCKTLSHNTLETRHTVMSWHLAVTVVRTQWQTATHHEHKRPPRLARRTNPTTDTVAHPPLDVVHHLDHTICSHKVSSILRT